MFLLLTLLFFPQGYGGGGHGGGGYGGKFILVSIDMFHFAS